MHCPRSIGCKSHSQFWKYQHSIIEGARIHRGLQIFVAQVHPASPPPTTRQFCSDLCSVGWHITAIRMSYADFGDSIDNKATVFIGVHSCSSIKAKHIPIPTLPQIETMRISHFLLEEYNKVNYALSYAKSSRKFIYQGRQMVAKDAVQEEAQHSRCLYNLVDRADNSGFYSGCGVFDTNFPSLPLNCKNDKIFGRLFGIEFEAAYDDHWKCTLVRQILHYKFVSQFGFDKDLTLRLAEPEYLHLLDGGLPSHSSIAILEAVFTRLAEIRQEAFKLIDNSSTVASAASAQAFFSRAIGACLPDRETRMQGYNDGRECTLIWELVANPSLVKNKMLQKIHYSFRGPL